MEPRNNGMNRSLPSRRPSFAFPPPHLTPGPAPYVNDDHTRGYFPVQFAEMLSGRYADVLSGLFLGYATLWYTSHHKNVRGLDKVTDFAMQVSVRLTHAAVRRGAPFFSGAARSGRVL